jgi:hypothetical protein
MYSVTVLRACCGPGACAHRLRTDALASSRQCPHNAANPGTRDLPFRTIPAVADQFRQGSKDTANAVWVYSPSGVQIPEPPLLISASAEIADPGGGSSGRIRCRASGARIVRCLAQFTLIYTKWVDLPLSVR